MKLTQTLLITALLVLIAPVLGAETTAQDMAPTPSGEAVSATLPAGDCQSTDNALVTSAWHQGTEAASQSCGSCSDAICVGRTRGSWCGNGPQGPMWCNIFSGGYMCPQGGWECQCQGGYLP